MNSLYDYIGNSKRIQFLLSIEKNANAFQAWSVQIIHIDVRHGDMHRIHAN